MRERTVASLFLGVMGICLPAVAARPQVDFDFAQVVGCQDVTDDAFRTSHPGMRLVEMELRVSLQLTRGPREGLLGWRADLVSPQHSMRVIDFSPQTRLDTDVVGEIETTVTTDQSESAAVNVQGRLHAPTSVVDVEAKPSVELGQRHHTAETERRRLRPERTIVVVSGTTEQEHGVFFKFKRSTQLALEGSHLLVCRFAVPEDWRGDWLQVRCRAEGMNRVYFWQRPELCGELHGRVAVYLTGDKEGLASAERLVAAERDWLKSQQQEAEVNRQLRSLLRDAKVQLAAFEDSVMLRNSREATAAQQRLRQAEKELRSLAGEQRPSEDGA